MLICLQIDGSRARSVDVSPTFRINFHFGLWQTKCYYRIGHFGRAIQWVLDDSRVQLRLYSFHRCLKHGPQLWHRNGANLDQINICFDKKQNPTFSVSATDARKSNDRIQGDNYEEMRLISQRPTDYIACFRLRPYAWLSVAIWAHFKTWTVLKSISKAHKYVVGLKKKSKMQNETKLEKLNLLAYSLHVIFVVVAVFVHSIVRSWLDSQHTNMKSWTWNKIFYNILRKCGFADTRLQLQHVTQVNNDGCVITIHD